MTEPTHPPPQSPSSRILQALWRVWHVIRRDSAARLEQAHGIHFGQYVLLERIDGGVIYPRQLSEHMAVPPSQVSRMLEDLTKGGLVERSLDPQDSRRIRLSLTERGRAVLEDTRRMMGESFENSLRETPPERLERMAEDLEALTDQLREVTVRPEACLTPDPRSDKESA